MERIYSLEQENKAKSEAFKLLSRRDYSEREIVQKLLRKGFEQSIVENVVNYLKEEGYINDKKLGERLKEIAIEKGKSNVFLKKKLYSKGICNIELSYSEELESAKNLLRRKYKGDKNFKQIVKFLLNRGFSYGIASEAAKSFLEE